jgi:site-specific recombinase XerD
MIARVHEILAGLSPVLFQDMSTDQVSHRFTKCAKHLGLTGLKPHSLRHTFGTYLIAMGYDIAVVKDLPGHEDIKTALIYAKANDGLLRDAIRSFEQLGSNGYKWGGEEGKATWRE